MPTLEQLLPLLEAEPQDAFLRYAVAMELAKQGQFEQSMAQFDELLRRHADYVAGYFMAGRTGEQKGDTELAKTLYRRGIEAARRIGDKHAEGEISAALEALE